MDKAQPTFVLGGQPYVFTPEVERGGPEMAERAFFETRRALNQNYLDWQSGIKSDEERLLVAVELLMGLWLLRDLIPNMEVMLPNRSLLTVH